MRLTPRAAVVVALVGAGLFLAGWVSGHHPMLDVVNELHRCQSEVAYIDDVNTQFWELLVSEASCNVDVPMESYVCTFRKWDEDCLAPMDDRCLKRGKCDQDYRSCSTTHTARVVFAEDKVGAESFFRNLYECNMSPVDCSFVPVGRLHDCPSMEGDVECTRLISDRDAVDYNAD